MGFEPTTSCLGSKHSTPELRPLGGRIIANGHGAVVAVTVVGLGVVGIEYCLAKSLLFGGKTKKKDIRPRPSKRSIVGDKVRLKNGSPIYLNGASPMASNVLG